MVVRSLPKAPLFSQLLNMAGGREHNGSNSLVQNVCFSSVISFSPETITHNNFYMHYLPALGAEAGRPGDCSLQNQLVFNLEYLVDHLVSFYSH